MLKHNQLLAAAIAAMGAAVVMPVVGADPTVPVTPPDTSPITQPRSGDTSIKAGGAMGDAAAGVGVSAQYSTLDVNQDGMLTKKEVAKDKALKKNFAKLDVNTDGKLDASEFAKFEAESSTTTQGSGSTPP